MIVPAQEIEISTRDRETILAEIGGLLEAGRLSGGRNIEGFEREFAAFVGAKHAVAVSSGTTALELIMLSLDVAGRQAIVPANTNFATWVAAHRAGAQVLLCDVDTATLSPRLEDIQAVATGNTAAVVIVHMGGVITPEIDRIAHWCREKGIALVEDAAHAHGSRRDNRWAGTLGAAGAYSFFPTKVMTTGEGGMVVTNDDHLADESRLYRNLGKAELWVSHHTRIGTNGRMTELAAVIGRQQLARLDANVSARQEVAALYREALHNIAGLDIVTPDHPYSGYKVVAHLTEPSLDRDAIKKDMASAGIQLTGEIYAEPLHHQPAIAQQYAGLRFPSAETTCARQICLPIYPTLGRERAELVISNLKRIVDEHRNRP